MSSDIINIYCDESCHLEHEQETVMLVSCIHCPIEKVGCISNELRAIKERYGILKRAELKWHKISRNKKNYYFDLVNYFINNDDIKFRTVIIPHKEKLKHEEYGQTHSQWYYKMIYTLVKFIPKYSYKNIKNYNIYIDKKENSFDARQNLITLKNCLEHYFYKYNFHTQNIVSNQSELLQLNDFLQGAVSYYNRGYCNKIGKYNQTKIDIVNLIQEKLNLELDKVNTNKKFNIFIWEADSKDE